MKLIPEQPFWQQKNGRKRRSEKNANQKSTKGPSVIVKEKDEPVRTSVAISVHSTTPAVFHAPPALLPKAHWKAAEDDFSPSWEVRSKFVKDFCWFIPTLETVSVLAELLKGKKVVEPASGTGFLAAHLRLLGVTDYTAIDMFSSQYWETSTPNYGSIVGNALDYIRPEYDAVVLCWPPYAQPFGAEVVKRMVSGQVLILQGESWGGCTGDDDLFHILGSRFERVEEMEDMLNEHHVRFYGINDYWEVHRCVTTTAEAVRLHGMLSNEESK